MASHPAAAEPAQSSPAIDPPPSQQTAAPTAELRAEPRAADAVRQTQAAPTLQAHELDAAAPTAAQLAAPAHAAAEPAQSSPAIDSVRDPIRDASIE